MFIVQAVTCENPSLRSQTPETSLNVLKWIAVKERSTINPGAKLMFAYRTSTLLTVPDISKGRAVQYAQNDEQGKVFGLKTAISSRLLQKVGVEQDDFTSGWLIELKTQALVRSICHLIVTCTIRNAT